MFFADHYYLSARLLYLHGLIFAGDVYAAYSLEFLFKAALKCSRKAFSRTHDLIALWELLNPPFSIDGSYRSYMMRLTKASYNKHPDSKCWDTAISARDDFGLLDYLYIKIRKWVCSKFENGIQTELDWAKDGKQLFLNVVHRHGAWDFKTILSRSNNFYELI